jgi:two-component system, cell cycle response regulator DivK
MDAEKILDNRQKTVLVVEDDEFYYCVLKKFLSQRNYRIIHAWNGKEAVDLFRSNDGIDLILMDIQMPVMDGFSATREIRKLDDHVPVIVQTAYTGVGMKEKAFSSGCNDVITKPVEREILVSKMGKYLG